MNPSKFIYSERVFNGLRHTHDFVPFKKLTSKFAKLSDFSACYYSSFLFTEDILNYIKKTGSESGYPGECFTEFIRFDIDRDNEEKAQQDNIADALHEARKLIDKLRILKVNTDNIRCYFTGKKGFNVELPSKLFGLKPSENLNNIVKEIALKIADDIQIDTSIYDKVRLFRIPNSIHEDTGLYKIPLSVDELFAFNEVEILNLATETKPFPSSFKLNSIKSQENLKALYLQAKEDLESKPLQASAQIDLNFPPRNTKLCYWRILNEGVNKQNPGRHLCALRLVKYLKQDLRFSDDICFSMLQQWDLKNNPPLQSEGRFKEKEIQKLIVDGAKYDWGCHDSILSSYCDDRCFLYKRKQETYSIITATELETLELPEQTPIIEKGIAPAQCGLIIAGPSEVGKSLFILEMAIRICTGMNILDFSVPETRKVLIAQKENSLASMKYRLKRINAGLSIIEPLNTLFLTDVMERFNLGKDNDLDRLKNHIGENNVDVCFLDPLSSFHTRDENDNMAMREILDRLTDLSRVLNCAFFVVHHYGKQDEYRGASSIKDWADTFIGYEQQYHIQRILRKMKFIKVRNGPKPRPILIERDYNNFTHEVIPDETICPSDKVVEILDEMGGRAESKKALIEEISKQVECSDRTARRAVDKAITDKIIGEQKEGKRKIVVLPDS